MSVKAADIHPFCTSDCTHRQVPDLGGIIVQSPVELDRVEAEAAWIAWFRGKGLRDQSLTDRVDYLGILGEGDGLAHAWRCGGKKWKPLPATVRTEGKQAKREIKYEYRPAAWLGSGEPVGPVDFSREAEPAKQPYPAPSLTSADPLRKPTSAPAAGLLRLALSLGWDGAITQAEGHVPHSTLGTPGKAAKFSEAVRLRRDDRRAVAVRMGGSWASLWTWSPDQFFTRHSTLAAFQEALT